MHIFNEVRCSYSIPSKIFTRVMHIPKHWNPMKIIQVIVWAPSIHDRAPRFIKKRVKKIGKNTNIEIQQNSGIILCVPVRSLWIWRLKVLARKLTSGMPKMPKSHDQPLCAYLMRYDAHIQSDPRSLPNWCMYQKKLKSGEKNSSYHPDTDGGRTDRQTNGRTDRWTDRVNPVYLPQLRCGGYNKQSHAQ